MKIYLVDSDVLIDFFKKRQEAVSLIEQLSEVGTCIISVISVAELRSGWNKEEASMYLPCLYNIFEVVELSKNVAELAGEYRQKYSKKGTALPTIDSLIAATAIVNEYSLVSRNKKHYPMSELNLYQEIY